MAEVSERTALDSPPTNLLAMPMVGISVIAGNNEDWIDSLKFYVDDGTGAAGDQLDLTGINFDMEIRRNVPDHEVVIRASTKDGTLRIGDPPNFGFLLIGIDHDQMKLQNIGTYVGDIVGSDALSVRRVISVSLEIVEGVTRP